MKAIQIKTKDELQSFLQGIVERIESLEKQVDVLDREIEVVSEEIFQTPPSDGYSA